MAVASPWDKIADKYIESDDVLQGIRNDLFKPKQPPAQPAPVKTPFLDAEINKSQYPRRGAGGEVVTPEWGGSGGPKLRAPTPEESAQFEKHQAEFSAKAKIAKQRYEEELTKREKMQGENTLLSAIKGVPGTALDVPRSIGQGIASPFHGYSPTQPMSREEYENLPLYEQILTELPAWGMVPPVGAFGPMARSVPLAGPALGKAVGAASFLEQLPAKAVSAGVKGAVKGAQKYGKKLIETAPRMVPEQVIAGSAADVEKQLSTITQRISEINSLLAKKGRLPKEVGTKKALRSELGTLRAKEFEAITIRGSESPPQILSGIKKELDLASAEIQARHGKPRGQVGPALPGQVAYRGGMKPAYSEMGAADLEAYAIELRNFSKSMQEGLKTSLKTTEAVTLETTGRLQEIDQELAKLQTRYEKLMSEPQGVRPPSIQKDRLAGISNQMDKLDAEKAKLSISKVPEVGIPRPMAGTPETGLQAGMGELGVAGKPITPIGKGKSTQIGMDDAVKLAELRAAEGITTKQQKAMQWVKDEGIVDLSNNPITVDKDGMVTLYHRTSQESADQMSKTGKFISKENTGETLFSNKLTGQAEGYGDVIVSVKVPAQDVRLDDAFRDEIHVAVSNKKLSLRNIQTTAPLEQKVVSPVKPVEALPGMAGKGVPAGTSRAIALAEEKVKQAKPGAISKIIDTLPITKQVSRFFVPAHGLTTDQHVAWVARSVANADYLTSASAARNKVLQTIDAAFGPEFKKGSKLPLEYIGPVERAKSPLVGTSVDVLPNPDHYVLNQVQRDAVAQLGTYEKAYLDKAVNEYGTKIGTFPVKEGAAFIPNVDVSESALEILGNSYTAAKVGRAKTRVWEDAISRQMHDPTFKPEKNLETLLVGSDEAKGNLISSEVFKARLGGLNKLEVLQETHPKLATKMIGLRKRLTSLRGSAGRLETKVQESIDEFLSSPIDDIDLITLRDNLDIKLKTGPRKGMSAAAINKEIQQVRAQIRALQPYWKAANTKPYVFVKEGVFRYFPVNEAKGLKQLLEVSNNPILNLAWQIRNTAFNLDLSPLTGVHLPLGFLADPLGTARQVVRGVKEGNILHNLSQTGLAEKVAKDPTWLDYAAAGGRAVGHTPEEFAGGILNRIPGYSKANEAMFTLVTYRSKAMFDDIVKGLEKAGIPHNEAIMVASETVHKAIPLVDSAILGQSRARAKLLQSVTISPSFLLRPPELLVESAKALVKAGLKQTLTAKEKMALKVALTLAGTIETISVTSAVIDAVKHGNDPQKAAMGGLTDMSIHLLNGRKIPIGGPYRSLINAMRPGWINREMDYMMPFVRLPQWATGKITPLFRTQYDLIRNKDFFNRKIVTGEFPMNIIQAIAYEFEGAIPLSISAWMEGQRTGASIEKTAEESVTQLLGTSLYERPGPWNMRNEWRAKLKAYWDIPSNAIDRAKQGITTTREQYRQKNPDTDAKLFIVGDVTSLKSTKAMHAAVDLIQQNDLDPDKIRGIRARKEQIAESEKVGLKVSATLVDTLLKYLASPDKSAGYQDISTTEPTAAEQSWSWIRDRADYILLEALNKYWFYGGKLTDSQLERLNQIKGTYNPLGVKEWLNRKKQDYIQYSSEK